MESVSVEVVGGDTSRVKSREIAMHRGRGALERTKQKRCRLVVAAAAVRGHQYYTYYIVKGAVNEMEMGGL